MRRLKVSEKKKRYKEEPKGNFRMEKYYNQYKNLTGYGSIAAEWR